MHGHRVTFPAHRQLMPDVPQLAECSVAEAEVVSKILDGVCRETRESCSLDFEPVFLNLLEGKALDLVVSTDGIQWAPYPPPPPDYPRCILSPLRTRAQTPRENGECPCVPGRVVKRERAKRHVWRSS